MNEFISILLGQSNGWHFLACIVFGLIGAFANLLIETNNRDINSMRTPVNFDWFFLLFDNLRRLFTLIVLIFLFVRFSPDIVELMGLSESILKYQESGFIYVAIGGMLDYIIGLIKKKRKAVKNGKG